MTKRSSDRQKDSLNKKTIVTWTDQLTGQKNAKDDRTMGRYIDDRHNDRQTDRQTDVFMCLF